VIRRREFITLLGGAAAWPLAARAQQAGVPVIGVLGAPRAESYAQLFAAFLQGLKESGFVEGQNVVIEQHWANDQYDRLPAMAADFVRARVALIVTIGNNLAPRAAQDATGTIPIVFSTGSDPVQLGFVASLNRPSGNMTGASFLSFELGPKRLELLHQLAPNADAMAVLLNPNNPNVEPQTKVLQAAAGALGVDLQVLPVGSDQDIDAAFANMTARHVGAFLIGPDSFIFGRNAQIAALALRHGLPAMYQWREFAAAGGLISYGPSVTEHYRQAGVYAGRILKGERPADLPVVQSSKIEMVINLRTAKALGLTVPTPLLVAADEVLE
jgi:putative ABC transport system substrate-binding protein